MWIHRWSIGEDDYLFPNLSIKMSIFLLQIFATWKISKLWLKKYFHMSYLSHAETLYFCSGSEKFGSGSWSGVPDHDPVIFLSPGSTSAWIFPHDWGRMLEVVYVWKKIFFKVSKSFNSQKSAVKKWQFYPDFWKKDSHTVCSVGLVDKVSDYKNMGPSSNPRSVVRKVHFHKHEDMGCKKKIIQK